MLQRPANAAARKTAIDETLRIPSRETAAEFFRSYLLLSLVFVVVYGSINYLTSIRSRHFLPYFDWEARIPFIPGFVYLYLSIFFVFLLPLFSLPTRKIRALAGAFLTATVAAGCIFLILPAAPRFERPEIVPGYEFVFAWLYTFELPYNLFPSLHVTYATLILRAVAREENSPAVAAGLGLWWCLLIASVLLVRQHQIVDIIGGIALASLCQRLVYCHLAK